MVSHDSYVMFFTELGSQDVERVGGKNASLGEMITQLESEGIRVPGGFATTARAYWEFLDANELREKIEEKLDAWENGKLPLDEAGKAIREMIRKGRLPDGIAADIKKAYRELGERYGRENMDVAVRSSATAEDLPEASFAGQQETFLNISGEDALLEACIKCYASLFTDRAMTYRRNNNFDHMQVALSVGVQKMVRSDKSGSGVMFSIDPETGYPDVVLINAVWGLGEPIVQGEVDPDEFMIYKPLINEEGVTPIIEKDLGRKRRKMVYAEKGGKETTKMVDTPETDRNRYVLNDDEIMTLARWAATIEKHYGCPMDMEWARDGETDELYIVQARPETVQSQKTVGQLKTYTIKKKGRKLLQGLSVGDAIATGKVCKLSSPQEIDKFEDGCILVTGMTDPDWVPIMKKASGIVTNHGGRTSHAAIVSRELGLPAVVGTSTATQDLQEGQDITVSCAEGANGFIYEGHAEYEEETLSIDDIPETRTEIMLNMANPSAGFMWWQLPSDGVGLARMEFIIGNLIKIHPMALVHFDELKDKEAKKTIEELTRAYENKTDYFVDTLALCISGIAATHYPNPVIVRMSDFKTNEYAELIGGRDFEPKEENPMLGWRGASRYYSEGYKEGFALECRAMKKVREEIGMTNVRLMIPFCRTIEEADNIIEILAENGLIRGKNGLELYVMCEVPSNVILAEKFAERFDGFSIGSNDLTQLVLGVDRDSDRISHLFDEQNEAVKVFIADVIRRVKAKGTKIGICGQAPSDHPEFASFLVEAGIDSISVTPDSFMTVKKHVMAAEKARSASNSKNQPEADTRPEPATIT